MQTAMRQAKPRGDRQKTYVENRTKRGETRVTFWVTETQLERMDSRAQALGVSRQQVFEELLGLLP